MSNPLEIPQNTLLQLIVRQGMDSDRLNVVLKSGELGYTTDTKRLYIGDSVTYGGNPVGTLFAGSVVNITTVAPAVIGDLVFDTDNKNLYRLKLNDGSSVGDWELIGGVYEASDSTIVINSQNKVSVGTISGQNISPNSLENPIYLNGSNKLALSSNVLLDSIIPKNSTHLTLTPMLSVGGVGYTFPLSEPSTGQFLKNVGSNVLEWSNISLSAITNSIWTITNGLTASSNGIDVTNTPFNPLTATNVVVGVSPTLSSNNIWARYSGSADTLLANKGITSVTKTAVGKYIFNYSTLPTNYPSVIVQIVGSSNMAYVSRAINISNSQCEVIVTAINNPAFFVDSELSIQILS
jgi:hypothetical protein